MDAQATEDFPRFFTDLKDPGRHNVVHCFSDLMTIAILAILCQSDDWVEVVEWAKAHQPWLVSFLSLARGIPSVDTFRRVFARIDPVAFARCFVRWTQAVARVCPDIVAVDGKTLRRSFAHAWDKQGMMHLVSAWCCANQLVLGQLAVADKSNEITAIRQLLELLQIKGAIVTIDAMGCQREIAAKILSKGADYVLAVKDNQPTLHTKVRVLMQDIVLDHAKGHAVRCGFDQQISKGHGRLETRRVWVTDEIAWLGPELLGLWEGLGSIVMVEHAVEPGRPAGPSQRRAASVHQQPQGN